MAVTTSQQAIKSAKAKAWDELVNAIDRIPCCRLYRLVFGRFRTRTLPITESLDLKIFWSLENILVALFPSALVEIKSNTGYLIEVNTGYG